MQNAAIELFYIFFQGILIFQVLIFGVLFFITKRKDLLYYCLFLFFASLYFFIKAPYTFFRIPEETVWHSRWYDLVNTPVIIVENLFYLLFLQAFFADITTDKAVKKVLSGTLKLIPVIFALFVLMTLLHMNKQAIFYTVKLITIVPAVAIVYTVLKQKVPFLALVSMGLLCTIVGTCTTVLMIVLGNYHVKGLFTESYPLFFIRLGLLGDMVFYMIAIIKKWHMQEKQAAVAKLEGELSAEKLRNKISGQLHDDMGSTLSGISMYTYMANDLLKTGQYEQVGQSLGVIQKSAQQLVSNLGDMVWTIRARQESFETLFDRLQQYGSELCAAKNIQFRSSCDIDLANRQLSMEARSEVYLFLKEAINNAVKHSSANAVSLSLVRSGDYLEFSVSDNGTGFDERRIKKGNGLCSMQERASEIGATLALQSNERGTHVSMRYKIT
jgi:signal transduction histidine kinase